MKVKAKHWLKHNGVWYKGGDTFEIPTTDAKELEGMVELDETPVFEPVVEEKPVEQPKRRGRKAKAETAE